MGRLVVDEKLTGVAQDLGREWRIKYAAAKQRALADPASVDEYGIYRHNWRCETRVVRQMIVSSDGSVREIWHRQL